MRKFDFVDYAMAIIFTLFVFAISILFVWVISVILRACDITVIVTTDNVEFVQSIVAILYPVVFALLFDKIWKDANLASESSINDNVYKLDLYLLLCVGLSLLVIVFGYVFIIHSTLSRLLLFFFALFVLLLIFPFAIVADRLLCRSGSSLEDKKEQGDKKDEIVKTSSAKFNLSLLAMFVVLIVFLFVFLNYVIRETAGLNSII